jgi:hypothetical protein
MEDSAIWSLTLQYIDVEAKLGWTVETAEKSTWQFPTFHETSQQTDGILIKALY